MLVYQRVIPIFPGHPGHRQGRHQPGQGAGGAGPGPHGYDERFGCHERHGKILGKVGCLVWLDDVS